MARQALDFTLLPKPKGRYYYGKIKGWSDYRSTGETRKADALRVVRQWFDDSRVDKTVTFGNYAKLFYGPDCPH